MGLLTRLCAHSSKFSSLVMPFAATTSNLDVDPLGLFRVQGQLSRKSGWFLFPNRRGLY